MSPIALRGGRTSNWKPPQVLLGCINIAGGFGGWTPTVATSIQYTLENEIHTFIELNKNAPWFLKCVGGAAAQRLKGYLASVNILSDIRDRVNALIKGPDTAVADEHDSIDALDDDENAVADDISTDRTRKRNENTVTSRSAVYEIEMPMRPTCSGHDVGCTTTIIVYITPKYNRKSPIYLRSDFIPWLIAYAVDEYHYHDNQDNARDASASVPTRSHEPNCPAVPNLLLSHQSINHSIGVRSWLVP